MRTNSTLAVIFYTRRKNNNPRMMYILARITVNRKRAEISVKRSVAVKDWDGNKGRPKPLRPALTLLNTYLDEVYTQILEAHKQLVQEHKCITAQAIKARFLGQDDNGKTLRELIEYHNKTQVTVLRPGTLKNYSGTKNYLLRFLEEKCKLPDVPLKQLNFKFINDFEYYVLTSEPLQKGRPCTQNGAMKHMERLMKMVNLAIKLEWLEKDPFRNYKRRYKKGERPFLTERELQILEETIFTSPGLEKVKDVFLFSCYTGLSYVDAFELRKDQLVLGIDGNYWIHSRREKTSETLKIPLLPQALEILRKYENEPQTVNSGKLLPLYTNQKINAYLKEITRACGFHKHITFHTARHTFATTITLSNGVPIETVSKMLGHTKLSTTQIYARVLEHKIGKDMDSLREKMYKKAKKTSGSSIKNQTRLTI